MSAGRDVARPTDIRPPFTAESAAAKVQAAEDAWNSGDAERVVLAYTEDSEWRNRDEFLTGRDEIRSFLGRKWDRERGYHLRKSLWAFTGNRIAVRFEYESCDEHGQWWRSYGNENWEFDEQRPHGPARGVDQRRHDRGEPAALCRRGAVAMRVAELWRYPVKSMAGETLQHTEIGIRGIPGDRVLYVLGARGQIVSARNRPQLLAHHATIGEDGDVLVDGLSWTSGEVAAAVQEAAGPGARLVRATGPERFDVLPLLVATDGAIAAFGHDRRRLRPNIVLSGVAGPAERTWEGRQLAIADVVVALADLRARCVITTWDPETLAQDVDVLRHIRTSFDGTLALNAWAGTSGRIAVGDEAQLLERPVHVEQPALGRFG